MLRIPLLSVCLSLVIATCSAMQISNDACGKGYDTISGEIRQSPFERRDCQTSVAKSPIHQMIGIVENYDQLFKWIGIPCNKAFFQHSLVRRLLENSNINPYTVTIALIEQRDLFDTSCNNTVHLSKKSDQSHIYHLYGDAYISHVMTGGRDVILYHIQTPSLKTKKSVLKQFAGEPLTKKMLKRKLTYMAQKYPIVIKEYFSEFLHGVPASDINESLHHTAYFENITRSNGKPYRYMITHYRRYPDQNLSEKTKILQKEIDTILKNTYAYNAYHYYRHHQKDFLRITPQKRRELNSLSERSQRMINRLFSGEWPGHIDINSSEEMEALIPNRYKSPLPKSNNQKVPSQNITFKIEDFAKIIAPKESLYFQFDVMVDIQNQGKLVRITKTLIVKRNNKTYNKSDKQILYDAYVDFPGIRFAALSQNYGSCNQRIHFDKYTKSFPLKCSGIVGKAYCQYSLAANGVLSLSCQAEKIASPEITFIHEENSSNSETDK